MGQNGTAIAVGAGVLLLSSTVTNMPAVWAMRIALFLGFYGMIAPFAGLPLPEPRSEKRSVWRIGLAIVAVVTILASFSQPLVDAWLRWRLPTTVATNSAPPPVATRMPPVVAYETVGGKPHVVVFVGLINNTRIPTRIFIQSKAVLRPVKDNVDEMAALQDLRDEVHREPRVTVVNIPAYDSSVQFAIRGPEIPRARWTAFEAAQERIYYYAILRVQLGAATYYSKSCGVALGNQSHECSLQP